MKVNPCALIERHQTRSRERILADSEIPEFWAAFDDAGLLASSLLKLILLTGQRPGEVAHMHRDHIVDGNAVRLGPDAGKLNPDSRESLADQFIRATDADFREGVGAPCYVPSKDFITVPSFADFHSQPEYYAAAFNELVHWTGHKSRLDRDLNPALIKTPTPLRN